MKKCHFIVLIIFSICWAACKNSNNNPVAPINFQNKGPLIPLDVGNIWVYVDSVTTTTYGSLDTVSSLHVSFDSVAILNKWIFGKDTLYIPTYSVNFIWPKVVERNDSVFSADVIGTSDGHDSLVLTLAYFIPPVNGEVKYRDNYFASAHENKLKTLVGSFDKYCVYAYHGAPFDSTYIVPKVGIVRKVSDYMDTRLYPRRTKKITNLIHYSLRQ